MAAVDREDINTAIMVALRANTDLEALIGADANMRLFFAMPRGVATFPFVRVDTIPSVPITGTKKGPGIEWVRTHSVQFSVFDNKRAVNRVAAIQKQIAITMDAAPETVDITGLTGSPKIFQSIVRNEFCRYEAEGGTSVALSEYELWISSV